MIDQSKLIEAANKGIVELQYKSLVSGTIKTIQCTLNKELINSNIIVYNQQLKNDIIALYSLTDKRWEGIKSETIKSWSVYGL
jgi:phosphopantetheine adenylyltransferase